MAEKTKAQLEQELEELKAKLAVSESKEADAHLVVKGKYKSKSGKVVSFKKGYVRTRLADNSGILKSELLIKAANDSKSEKHAVAVKTLERLVKIGYAGIEVSEK